MSKSDCSIRASVLIKPGQIEMQSRPRPAPGPDEVLVRIACVGVCGSDIHYYRHGRIGDQILKSPQCLGHEGSGYIEAIGSDVRGFEVGQLVALEPSRVCGWCSHCRQGNYNLCPQVKFLGTPPIEGIFQEYYVFHFSQCFPVPAGVSPAAAAMIEPFVTGLCASRSLRPEPGHSALIIGVGAIGLGCVNMARLYGATCVIALDKLDHRLELAAHQGATHTLNVTRSDPLDFIHSVAGSPGVDCVYESSGAGQEVAQLMVTAAVRNGKLSVMGIPLEDELPLPIHEARRRGLIIHNVRRFANCYPAAIRLVASGKVDPEAWVTHRFSLEQIPQALELADSYADGVVKALIEM
ncbi:MAG: alcohol dehydrogenase catalytic domain-containing protein [Actinobacteria bacterium]|nr:alcohol dehydrogenase catalytic domain-containing protein [Actinomycetota bacterium]